MKKVFLLIPFIVIAFILIFLSQGCNKNPASSESSIGVEWETDYNATYNYIGGLYVGKTYNFGFTVIKGSGDLKITAEVKIGDKNTKSVNHDVVEGEAYILKVPVSPSSLSYCSFGSIIGKIEISAGYTPKRVLNFQCGYENEGYRKYTIGDMIVE